MKYTLKIDISSLFFGRWRCGKAQKTSGKRRVTCLTRGLPAVSQRLSKGLPGARLRCRKVTGMLSAFLRVLLISVPWEVLENIDLNDVGAYEITNGIGSTLGCDL